MTLRWEKEPGANGVERAFSGGLCVGMIGALADEPGAWWYVLDGVVMNRVERCDGHVGSVGEARREVEAGWAKWCEAAQLAPHASASSAAAAHR
jgi:hypothetical protein